MTPDHDPGWRDGLDGATLFALFPPHPKRIEARLPAVLVLRRDHVEVHTATVIGSTGIQAWIGGVIGLILLITVAAPGRRNIAMFNERLHEAGIRVGLTRMLTEQPMWTRHGS